MVNDLAAPLGYVVSNLRYHLDTVVSKASLRTAQVGRNGGATVIGSHICRKLLKKLNKAKANQLLYWLIDNVFKHKTPVKAQPVKVELVKPLVNNQLTMSSLEIAELTGKRHDHVMSDIRTMLAELGLPNFGETPYVHPQNKQTYPSYNLDFRLSHILVAGYSIPHRAAIVDRWIELEGKEPKVPSLPTPSMPTSFSQALRLAADKQEEVEKLQAELAVLLDGSK
ncbi:MAG: Rha family transcriptional regulator [Pseudomonadota bacterium]|nr:Rha family transcriptional regulator [Pseudomonadota bacterium]